MVALGPRSGSEQAGPQLAASCGAGGGLGSGVHARLLLLWTLLEPSAPDEKVSVCTPEREGDAGGGKQAGSACTVEPVPRRVDEEVLRRVLAAEAASSSSQRRPASWERGGGAGRQLRCRDHARRVDSFELV